MKKCHVFISKNDWHKFGKNVGVCEKHTIKDITNN